MDISDLIDMNNPPMLTPDERRGCENIAAALEGSYPPQVHTSMLVVPEEMAMGVAMVIRAGLEALK